MRKNYVICASVLSAILILPGCYYDPHFGRLGNGSDTTRVEGYVPVYGAMDGQNILLTAPRRVEDSGKIYVYGKYLLVNEKKRGIHVFDNSDPGDPANLGFIQMLGNTDMAIKDGLLYADHVGNLVALSVNDFETIEEEGRLPLNQWNFGLPPPSGYPFECVDPDLGLVVSWKKELLLNPACYAMP